ncbi:alpha/beta hydrolase [Ottowia thiooxydans]|uniref:alpha/beta hydrolase n=1 Tax=Ottowia thiooxydans TaxID=219182 RepID=UPI00040F7750|nr:alpha/beta hydrolase [Ottowia thiooxydans]
MALHPFIDKMLEAARASGRPALGAGTPADARALLATSRDALGPGPVGVSMEELQVPTRAGSVPARCYKPGAESQGLVLYLHGGGWVCGALEDFDSLARLLAEESGCTVLMLDYRLAPEHPFPAGLEDSEDALLWIQRDGMQQLLGRGVPLIVSGDSAGGNLGIAAVRATIGRVDVALQAYFYPVTDCDLERHSYKNYSEGMPLLSSDMRWFFEHYAPPTLWSDPRISVLRGVVAGTPPTWIATAEYDVLRDEGEAYAERLRVAGIRVELHRVQGLTHGFVRLFNLVDTARTAVLSAALAMATACKA